MRKGISPLIAAVILIAFVVAVASVVATFFTDIAGEWGEGIEGADPVNCAMMNLEITSVSNDTNSLNVSFRSTGSQISEGVTVNAFSGDEGIVDSEAFQDVEEFYDESPMPEGVTATVGLEGEDYTVVDEVELVSLDCTGVTDTYQLNEE